MMDAILGQPICRLLWKEWRSIRGFAIALLVFGLGLLWFCYEGPERGFNNRAEFIIPMIPIIALMGIVATTFAAEHEHKTAFMQRSLPASQTTVVASKLLTGLLVSGWLALIMLVVARMTHPHALDRLKPSETILAAFELFAWGTLISLLSRRALVALVVSSLIAVGVAYFVQWIISPSLWNPEDPRIWYVPAARWTIVGLVSLASASVGSAWFNDRSSEITSRLTAWRRINPQAVATRSHDAGTGVISQLARLTWCQVKADAWMWVGLLAFLILPFVRYFGHGPSTGDDALLILVIAAVLGCVATSKGESERHFLSTQSISPRLIWFSGLTLPAVVIALVSLAMWMGVDNGPNRVHPTRWMYALGAPAFGLAVGQLFARLTRSSVTAFGIAVLTGVFAAAWLAFSVAVEVPLRYSVLPFVVLSLIATFITTRSWLYGWSGRAVQVWKFGSIITCLTISLGAMGWFRATELPAVPAAKLAGVKLPAPAPEEKVSEFRRFGETIKRAHKGFDHRFTQNAVADDALVDRVIKGLKDDRFSFPTRSYMSTDQGTLGYMISLMSNGVRQSIKDNNPEETQRRIEALLDLGEMIKASGFGSRYRWGVVLGDWYRPDLAVLEWARMENTTPEQIAEVLGLTRKLFWTVQKLNVSIAVQANEARRLANGDLDLLPEYYDRWERSTFAVGVRLPWERARIHRFIDGQQVQSMSDVETYASVVAKKTFPVFRGFYRYENDAHLLVNAHKFYLPDLRSMLWSLRDERAFAVRLALIRYQKLHDGELPDTVMAVKDELPAEAWIDPLQGRPFILVHPEAIADWVARTERPYRQEWEPDPMKRYRNAFLWSANFYVEVTPDNTREDMTLWVDEDHEFPQLSISQVIDGANGLPVQSHVPGNPSYGGSGTTYSLVSDFE